MLRPKSLGILSLVPPLVGVVDFAGMFAWIVGFGTASPGSVLLWGPVALFVASAVAIVAVVTLFIIDAARRPRVDNRAVWILLIVCVWPVGPFIYWLVQIRANAQDAASDASAPVSRVGR